MHYLLSNLIDACCSKAAFVEKYRSPHVGKTQYWIAYWYRANTLPRQLTGPHNDSMHWVCVCMCEESVCVCNVPVQQFVCKRDGLTEKERMEFIPRHCSFRDNNVTLYVHMLYVSYWLSWKCNSNDLCMCVAILTDFEPVVTGWFFLTKGHWLVLNQWQLAVIVHRDNWLV